MIICIVRREDRFDLLESSFDLRQTFCQAAARSGQLKRLKLFHKCDVRMDALTCVGAAAGGHLEILKWVHAKKYMFRYLEGDAKSEMCSKAAENGHLEVLKWARENGCPWDAKTCAYAAYRGDLEMLKWARDNDCPWDELTCACAALSRARRERFDESVLEASKTAPAPCAEVSRRAFWNARFARIASPSASPPVPLRMDRR